jgi:hypothetical protein
MRRGALLIGILAAACAIARAQWDLEDSHTTADLRGIDNLGGGVAWASGTNGTVLRTEDGGYLWQACTVPPGAEHLDFRGIQAFDANTAIVMSSGKGDLSRLYKTTDGCQTWKLVFTNPDKDGFWDAVRFLGDKQGVVLGDPVNGHFRLFQSIDAGETWTRASGGDFGMFANIPALKDEGVFAASNSALFISQTPLGFVTASWGFVTGGPSGSRIFLSEKHQTATGVGGGGGVCELPLGNGTLSSGAFSVFGNPDGVIVAVGGDYQSPELSVQSARKAPFLSDCKTLWHSSETPPHGYRSAVAYDASSKTWITVGPNGTDVSTDDGKNWRAVHPDAALHEPPDADKNWNALSLPFVVGPHGRIGKLEPQALNAVPN